jgi:hypothetical protein
MKQHLLRFHVLLIVALLILGNVKTAEAMCTAYYCDLSYGSSYPSYYQNYGYPSSYSPFAYGYGVNTNLPAYNIPTFDWHASGHLPWGVTPSYAGTGYSGYYGIRTTSCWFYSC